MKSHSLAPLPATLALSAFLVTPAFATETAPAAPAAPATVPAAAPEAGKIAEVTVTAKKPDPVAPAYKAEPNSFKRSAPALNTPQQVTVVSQQVLQDRNAVSLKDALRNSPGITMNAGEGGQNGGDNFNMRGFSAQSDIFIDGVRDTALYSRDMFFVDQVEIARGSSGVYQGRGSTGGSMNLVSKTPHQGNAGSLGLSAGTTNSLRAVADMNFDISKQVESVKDDGVAFRMVAMAQDGGSPRTADAEDGRFGLLPSIALGLGSATRVNLSHQYYEQNSDGDYGVPFGPPVGAASLQTTGTVANPGVGYDRSNFRPLTDSATNWYGIKGVSRDNTTANITTAVIESDIDDHNKLRNITRYNDNLRDTVIYRPNGVGTANAAANAPANTRVLTGIAPGSPQTFTPTTTTRLVQTDILSNQTDYVGKIKTGELAHTLNLGVELQQEQSSNRNRIFTNATGTALQGAPALNLGNPDSNTPTSQALGYGRSGTAADKTAARAETYGVYLNETLHVVKELDLIGGLRYDRYEATVKNHYTTTALSPTAATPANGTVTSFKTEDDLIGWRGGVVVKPTEQWSVYGVASNALNPSAGDLTLAANTAGLKPEQTYLYEIGTKWEPIPERLTFGLAYFYADKSNLRQRDFSNANAQVLTGQAISQGIEFTAAGAVTKKWNVFGGLLWNTTEIVKDSATVFNGTNSAVPNTQIIAPNLKGRELTNTPEWSCTLWTTYDIGDGWGIGGGLRYVGTRWADDANTARLDDYIVTDLALYKVVNKWCRLQVNVDNVADTRYLDNARAQNDGWALPGPGRLITGTVRLAF